MQDTQGNSESLTKVELIQLMNPSAANPAGNIHGGTIMKMIDEAGAIVGARYTRHNCVTAAVDRINFLAPAYIGNILIAKASLNYVGAKSMEIGVKMFAENLKTGDQKHVASAYLTYVALDNTGKPIIIPQYTPNTPEEKRRYEEGKNRHDQRRACSNK